MQLKTYMYFDNTKNFICLYTCVMLAYTFVLKLFKNSLHFVPVFIF